MSELRDQLEAAIAGTPEPVVAPVAAEAPVAEASAAPVEPTTPPPADTGAQPRDESGKFAPKAEAPAQAAAPADNNPPAETPAVAEPDTQAIRIPPSLPAAVKAKFAALEPDVRDAITKLEDSVQTAKAEWGKKGERLNAFEEIIAPHRDAWALQGLDDRGALQRLVAAEKVLRETPTQGIVALAQLYGVNLQQLVGQTAQGAQAQPQSAAPEVHPALTEMQREIQTLKDERAQQSQAQSKAQLDHALSLVAEFAADPAHMYFENVKSHVGHLLETGAASDLKTAYEMAIWASPEVRPLLLSAQDVDKSKKATEEAQRAKAAQAKAASGSVTGSPTPGAAPANAGPRASLREELLAAAQEHSPAL